MSQILELFTTNHLVADWVIHVFLPRIPSCARAVLRALCRAWRDLVVSSGLRVSCDSYDKFAYWVHSQITARPARSPAGELKAYPYFTDIALRGSCIPAQMENLTNYFHRTDFVFARANPNSHQGFYHLKLKVFFGYAECVADVPTTHPGIHARMWNHVIRRHPERMANYWRANRFPARMHVAHYWQALDLGIEPISTSQYWEFVCSYLSEPEAARLMARYIGTVEIEILMIVAYRPGIFSAICGQTNYPEKYIQNLAGWLPNHVFARAASIVLGFPLTEARKARIMYSLGRYAPGHLLEIAKKHKLQPELWADSVPIKLFREILQEYPGEDIPMSCFSVSSGPLEELILAGRTLFTSAAEYSGVVAATPGSSKVNPRDNLLVLARMLALKELAGAGPGVSEKIRITQDCLVAAISACSIRFP